MATETPADSQAAAEESWVDLEHYQLPASYQPGGRVKRVLWIFVSWLLFESGWFVLRGPKPALLRLFGAKIGRGVVIKPRVRIKFPWRLEIGNHVWIGEETWIDNLDQVTIGSHVCISQGSYFCTGSHDHKQQSFDLLTYPIQVDDGAWIAAKSILVGNIHVGSNALVAAGSVVTKNVARGNHRRRQSGQAHRSAATDGNDTVTLTGRNMGPPHVAVCQHHAGVRSAAKSA